MTKPPGISRRRALFGAATVLGAATAACAPAIAPAAAETAVAGPTITPDDPRYRELTTGNNQRFVAQPDYIRMITSSADAETAVREAVRTGKEISVRGGGHCFSDFVCRPDVKIILDVSPMTGVAYDPARRAFVVEAGARLVNVYETLFKNWNVTIPGGVCWSVGVAGHVSGAGYGLLCRSHGLTVDHLEAVEVVVVDAEGGVSTVIASRDEADPNHDLWWGHTGGGGGNFGVITRYWFRSPGATGSEPSKQLIAPPAKVLVSAIEYPWDQMTAPGFGTLLKNFGTWHEQNAAPGSATSSLGSLFNVSHRAHGSMGMFTQVDATVPGARALLDDYVAFVTAGSGMTPREAGTPMGEVGAMPGLRVPRELPWLQAARMVGTNNPTITNPTSRGIHKSAYMRKTFTDRQVASLYQSMSGTDFHNPDTMVVMLSFGGEVNAVAPDATAIAQRKSAFKLCFQTFWPDAADDPTYVGWIRKAFADCFADTGGAPVPNDATEGCYINYPDNDMADPTWNRSGVPWQTLYYKDNYLRLQQVKRRWDPTNFFNHPLSVEPAR